MSDATASRKMEVRDGGGGGGEGGGGEGNYFRTADAVCTHGYLRLEPGG